MGALRPGPISVLVNEEEEDDLICERFTGGQRVELREG